MHAENKGCCAITCLKTPRTSNSMAYISSLYDLDLDLRARRGDGENVLLHFKRDKVLVQNFLKRKLNKEKTIMESHLISQQSNMHARKA
jgi:hypothetical protein